MSSSTLPFQRIQYEVSVKKFLILLDTNIIYPCPDRIKKILKNEYASQNFLKNLKKQLLVLSKNFDFEVNITKNIREEFFNRLNNTADKLTKEGKTYFANEVAKVFNDYFKIFDSKKNEWDQKFLVWMEKNFSKSKIQAYDINDIIFMASPLYSKNPENSFPTFLVSKDKKDINHASFSKIKNFFWKKFPNNNNNKNTNLICPSNEWINQILKSLSKVDKPDELLRAILHEKGVLNTTLPITINSIIPILNNINNDDYKCLVSRKLINKQTNEVFTIIEVYLVKYLNPSFKKKIINITADITLISQEELVYDCGDKYSYFCFGDLFSGMRLKEMSQEQKDGTRLVSYFNGERWSPSYINKDYEKIKIIGLESKLEKITFTKAKEKYKEFGIKRSN
ncbi:MAG: hypothetical protein K4H23_04530 [Mollicutes bacterium PWAP]|nr:hypothetical protein [Mollicutes bacterium PWAP]